MSSFKKKLQGVVNGRDKKEQFEKTANKKTRLRYGKAIGIVRLEFKITMNNMLRVLMGKVDSMQE